MVFFPTSWGTEDIVLLPLARMSGSRIWRAGAGEDTAVPVRRWIRGYCKYMISGAGDSENGHVVSMLAAFLPGAV